MIFFVWQFIGEAALKKSCLVITAVLASVFAVNSSSLLAQAADVSSKTDQELVKQNATIIQRLELLLEKQNQRLELLEQQNQRLGKIIERQNAEFRDVVRSQMTGKKLAVAPKNTNRVESLVKPTEQAWTSPAAAISPAATNAYAADWPVKAPRGVAVGEHGFYAWLDGSYQRVNLPNYSLGFQRYFGNNSSGIIDSFDVHPSGGGIAGGIGYLLPYTPMSPWFGSDLRLEVAGSWIGATATQTAGHRFVQPSGGSVIPVLLNGTFGFQTCGVAAGVVCQTNSSLHTDYTNWQISGRIASDYRFGIVTMTPSLGLFGGNVQYDQTLAQTLASSVGPSPILYNAATSLHWTDLGGRLGLEGKVAIHPWVTLGLGGWVGWTDRWIDFAGNDSFSIPGVTLTSSIAESATKTAFLANLEASVMVRPTPAWMARAFIGLNYDDSVPGISTPSKIVGSPSGTPSGIFYAKETSYYAGGGAAYSFY